jgi:hypothetical protein
MKQWSLRIMRRLAIAFLIITVLSWALPDPVRFLRWADVQSLASGFTSGPDRLPEFKDPSEWDDWIRQRDAIIRARIDHGIEDSISALILFGASFPAPPKLPSAADAVNAAGDLTANARARTDAFVEAIDQIDNERFRIVLEFLRRRRVTEEELPAFLTGNLRRYALEQAAARKQKNRSDAGLPLESPMLVNFAIEDTLQALKTNGTLPARIHRIAVIGPGLDLAGDPDVSDYAPPQSIQPFAVLEAVLRLGVAQPSEVQLAALDLNPVVLANLRTSLSKARAGQRCLLQLPRATSAGWNSTAVAYWQRFGETIATPVASIAVMPPGIESRLLAVKPQIAARITVEDVNIIAQTLDTAPSQQFDLVVATNIFAYYNRVEQALALTGIARMLARGGILVANGLAPSSKTPEFQDLSTHHVAYTENGAEADDLNVYRRQ